MYMKPYLLCSGLLLGISSSVSGMIVESGNTIIIDQPVTQDLYLAGGTIVINAPVHGQLVIAAGKVFINDTVDRDVLVAGGSVDVKGYVGGQIRCLGGRLHLEHLLHGDLVVAGGEIVLDTDCRVNGSLLAAGGRITVYGNIQEDARVVAEQFQLYGSVSRNMECRAGTIGIHGHIEGTSELAASGRLDIGHDAVFNGAVRYWSPNTVYFGASVKRGQPIWDKSLAISTGHWYFLGYSGGVVFLWYLGMAMVLIIVLQYIFQLFFERGGQKLHEEPLRSFGTGLLFVLAVPLLIAATIASLVAMPIGFLLLVGYIFVLLTGSSIGSLLAAHWFTGVMGGRGKFWEQVGIAFVFFLLFRLVQAIPYVGWLLFLMLQCMVYGALLLTVRWKRSRTSAASEVLVTG
jgi:hypothetical protein